ncbi:hypothetical protein ACFYWY_22520 [Streptomyces sp. NPDC002870]|uniref:hypothetical protein n=1 Tax=Streptomyces sp. NPDC002870 TaxID=3364666 RepID=UPI0036C71CF9
MSVQRSVATCAACAAGARPRLGFGESAVIIVIIVMAVVMALRGTPLPELAAVLASAGLLAVVVLRLVPAGAPRSTALRSAGRALLSPGQA